MTNVLALQELAEEIRLDEGWSSLSVVNCDT
ncbi:class III lanthipeptide [Streptomyces rimosus]|nr:class III lanthipeptide [Streptomyces rimosus]